MPNVNVPRGFQPRKPAGAFAWSSTITTYKIPSGYATNIFTYDIVKMLTTGYLAKAVAGDQFRGVVEGFRYTTTDGRVLNTPVWVGGTVTYNAADVEVRVIDDPNVIVEARFGNASTVPTQATIGKTFNLFDNGGLTATGLSGEGVDITTQNTISQQFRCVGFSTRQDNDILSAYPLGLFAPLAHDFRVQSGV